jgi:hypothetical protein
MDMVGPEKVKVAWVDREDVPGQRWSPTWVAVVAPLQDNWIRLIFGGGSVAAVVCAAV